MASNKITLTIGGDATGIQRAAGEANAALGSLSTAEAHAAKQSQDLAENLEKTGQAAKGAREAIRGTGDIAVLFGGEMGSAALNASLFLQGVRGISKGAAELSPKIKSLVSDVGYLRLGLIGLAAAAAAGAVEATKSKTGWANLGQDAVKPLASQFSMLDSLVSKLPGDLGPVGSALDGITQSLRGTAGWSTTTAADLDALAAAAHRASVELANTYTMAADQNPGGDGFTDPGDLQAMSDQLLQNQADIDAARAAKQAAAARAGASAMNTAADAAKAAAQKLADAKKTVAEAVSGIVEAMAPILDPSSVAGGYSRVGDTNGGATSGLIANLKKQADDTLKLRKDLEYLAKAGLDKGLLTQLVNGGLDSLPAAEELMRGGKAEIGQANYYAGKINTRANTIATEQTARALTKSDKQQLDINVKGGDADLVKLIRKWVFANGGNAQKVLGS